MSRPAAVTKQMREWKKALRRGEILHCGICTHEITLEPNPILGRLSCDHIIPVKFGGPNLPRNFQPTHQRCNLFKGHRLLYVINIEHRQKINLMLESMAVA